MQYSTKHIFYGFFLAILVVVLFAGCGGKSVPQQQSADKSAPPPDTIAAFTLTSEQVTKDLTLAGDVLPLERAVLYAKVAGYVKRIHVDIGSQVQRGQVIATLEAPELTAKLAEARSRLLSVQAKCRSSADAYRRTLNASQTDGVIAAGELERIKNSMLADSAEEQSARFQVAAAQELERYLSITAPFNGVITKRTVDAGALVGTAGDKPLFELENTGIMRLRVAVPEAFSGKNIENRAVNFTVKAYPDKKFSAVFKRKTQSIDAATRSETWEFETGNPNFSLKAGMVADVKLRFARGVATFVVPPSAVVTTLERRFVIKISSGHTAWVDVSKGVAMKDKVEIFGALTPGDTLAKNGSEELKADKLVIARVP